MQHAACRLQAAVQAADDAYLHACAPCREATGNIFQGLSRSGMYRGSLLPVLAVDMPLYDVVSKLSRMSPTILPSSTAKILQCKVRDALAEREGRDFL